MKKAIEMDLRIPRMLVSKRTLFVLGMLIAMVLAVAALGGEVV